MASGVPSSASYPPSDFLEKTDECEHFQDCFHRKQTWLDWTNLALGLFLAVSPWLALGGSAAIIWNAVICGGVIACAAGVALLKPSPGAQKTNLWFGLWLLIAPFVLSFWSNGGATWSSVLVGLCVAGIAGYQLSDLKRSART